MNIMRLAEIARRLVADGHFSDERSALIAAIELIMYADRLRVTYEPVDA